ncbi:MULTISPECIES: HEAT repeat domain-containing protein [Streptacidiphilus]|uniref:HEAT repeat domain-containing protein n=1 Tax=Streptacidiphilus cavernicola TaxID=3342716 RepID=A0ABV6V163_9ACTN|nr:HEAT repeat domain-containing protein [Streptacidiphilus jeojiense]
MWVGLDEVDWAALEHNYGSAQNIPGLLRRCAGAEPDDVDDAAFQLLNHLFHQGGWICSAAPAALPYVVGLAASPDVLLPGRRMTLELVWRLAAEAGQVAAVDPEWQPAWEQTLPRILALLTDPCPEIRRDAAHILGICSSPGELVLPALLDSLQAEDDAAARLDLVLALGQAITRKPAGQRASEVIDLLRGLLDEPDAQMRLAAVHALAPSDPELPVRQVGALLEAIRDPSVELWRKSSTVEAGVEGVQHWTALLFPDPFPAFTLGLLADHDNADQRVGALSLAGGQLAQWRSANAGLLPALVARLHDSAPEVRFRAVELLACLGPAAAAYADDVVALLSDTAARATRDQETVAEGALWALARINDARCLPLLMGLMGGTRSGFASVSASYPVTAGWHYPVLPGLHEVLAALPDHCEVLAPAVGHKLASADDHTLNRLCQVLADWGPAAKAAIPDLFALLGGDRTWPAAAVALGGIGVAADEPRDALLARSGSGDQAELAAWAYWKVSGDPGPALAALGRMATLGRLPHPAVRRLADLGSHAAAFADQLRALTAAADVWTRVEAAHALWATTGDTEITVPALATAVQGLTKGAYQPVSLPAVRYLTQIGPAAAPAADRLRDVTTADQRLRCNGGWRGFAQDEAIRAAITELLKISG